MFGSLRRENTRLHRRIDNLAERVQTETKLRETAIGNQARMAQRFAAQHDELTQLRKEAEARAAVAQDRGNALGRLGNRLDNVETEYDHIDGYAARMELRLDRALKACARYRSALTTQHRVNDRLSNQLMDAMGYTDTALMRLSIDLADTGSETTP